MTVHPRRRGEHCITNSRLWCSIGSSPQARGTRCVWRRHSPPHRFIPAGAGNTCRRRPYRQPQAVHPRRRGEHVGNSLHYAWDHGSSPQARGTLWHRAVYAVRRRFIPAGAGNTNMRRNLLRRGTVHPRRRGEHASGVPVQLYSDRFIPAGAGNTWIARADLFWTMVHPRRRGEHGPTLGTGLVSNGSSPQARGTLLRDTAVCQSARFIPAGAGNTPGGWRGAGRRTVHPRRRGEHSLS